MTRAGTVGGLVHARAVAVGTGVALAICVPAALLAQVLDRAGSVDDDSWWQLVLTGVILVGMGVGGCVAANRRLDAPLANSAAAALAAYLLVQAIAAIRLLALGEQVTWVAIPFFALLSASAGMAGGLVADVRARRPR